LAVNFKRYGGSQLAKRPNGQKKKSADFLIVKTWPKNIFTSQVGKCKTKKSATSLAISKIQMMCQNLFGQRYSDLVSKTNNEYKNHSKKKYSTNSNKDIHQNIKKSVNKKKNE